MQYLHRKIIGYGALLLGIMAAPLLPFWVLVFVPLVLVWFGLPVSALLFAILLDSFLVPGGIAPFWVSCTVFTIVFLPLCLYVRYTTTL